MEPSCLDNRCTLFRHSIGDSFRIVLFMDLGSYSIMSPVHRCLYLAYPAPLQVEQLVYPFQESKKSCNQNTLVGIDIHLSHWIGGIFGLAWLRNSRHYRSYTWKNRFPDDSVSHRPHCQAEKFFLSTLRYKFYAGLSRAIACKMA